MIWGKIHGKNANDGAVEAALVVGQEQEFSAVDAKSGIPPSHHRQCGWGVCSA
jgi:hypothetical protein